MVHTPIHPSWLNQFEIRYNQTARPFKWRFTTTDLADLMIRLSTPTHPSTPAHNPAA